MIGIIRIFLLTLLSILICILGTIYCLFSPRNPSHVSIFSRFFGRMSHLLGIQVEIRYPESIPLPKNCIYIANHQNNYDMVTASYAVQPRTVTVGKRSLIWIPLFGLFYWLTGNLLIDRSNKISAYNTLINAVHRIKKLNMSLWIFPEGTRSRGRGFLPFKTGAFRAAIIAGVPIVPICISNTSNKIKLNRWSNGLVIVEILSPIKTSCYSKQEAQILANYCWDIMKNRINKLNIEVVQREQNKIVN